MPGALSATTIVSHSESRADLKKGKAPAFRLWEEMERLPHDPADHARVIQGTPDSSEETVSAGEAGTIKTEECTDEPLYDIRKKVEIHLKILEKNRQMSVMSPLSFCLIVVNALDHIRKTYAIDNPESQDYKFWASQLGPHYVSSLRPALKIMRDKASAQQIWEYYKNIVGVAKYLFLQPDASPDKSDNNKLMKTIYKMAIECEIHYLKSVRNSSLPGLVTHPRNIISYLLNWKRNKLKCSNFSPLSREDVNRYYRQMEELTMGACASRGGAIVDQLDHNDGAIDERIEQLEESLRNKTANMLDVRLYNGLLQLRLRILGKEEKKQKSLMEDGQGRAIIHTYCTVLEQLFIMHNKCVTFIPDHTFMHNDIAMIISGAARNILAISLDNIVQLEKEVLELIDDLMHKGLLSEACMKSYLYYKELRALMGTAIQTREMTDQQCEAELKEIGLLLDEKTDTCVLEAVNKLEQLLFFHSKEIQALCTKNLLSELDITFLRSKLSNALLSPVAKKIDRCKKNMGGKSDLHRFDAFLRGLRSTIITLNPCVFIAIDKPLRQRWLSSACFAWRLDLERMARKEELLTEEDVDCLLELKHVVPDVPKIHVRETLIEVLNKCSDPMLADRAEVPVEKIMSLTEWRTELDCLYKLSS